MTTIILDYNYSYRKSSTKLSTALKLKRYTTFPGNIWYHLGGVGSILSYGASFDLKYESISYVTL